MKTLRRILPLLLIVCLSACCPEEEPATFTFEIDAFDPNNYDYRSFSSIEDNTTISYDSYAILVESSSVGLEDARPPKRKRSLFRSPDCGGPLSIVMLEDEIVNISIAASEDFSPDHQAGTDLSSLFNTIHINLNLLEPERGPEVQADESGISLAQLNSYLARHHDLVDFSRKEEFLFFGFRLNTAPEQAVTLKFHLTVEFESGKILEASTTLITIEP